MVSRCVVVAVLKGAGGIKGDGCVRAASFGTVDVDYHTAPRRTHQHTALIPYFHKHQFRAARTGRETEQERREVRVQGRAAPYSPSKHYALVITCFRHRHHGLGE
jgi:hypothetical protein